MPSNTIRAQIDGAGPSRARGGLLIFLVILVIAGMGLLGPYADYLWFSQDARHPEVFLLEIQTRSTLFGIGLFVSTLFLFFNLRIALSQTPVFGEAPAGWGPAVGSLISYITSKGADAARIFALILGFVGASQFSENWKAFVLANHAAPFGKSDPLFGLDYSFYVFKLPWYQALTEGIFSLLLITTILVVGIDALYMALSMASGSELSRPNVSRARDVLIGLLLLSWSVLVYLGRYTYATASGTQFTGAGYTDQTRLTLLFGLAILLAALAVVMFVGAIGNRTHLKTLGVFAGIIGVYYGIFLIIVPQVIQGLVVEGDKVNKEAPFADRAITATRFGFGVDHILSKDFTMKDQPTSTEINESQTTLDNMRLWDPSVLQQSLESIQGLKAFYTFDDVDVDRYTIGGRKQMVMISARNIQLAGLSGGSDNWVNTRLKYTHGYGVAMARVNETASEGQPSLIAENMPVASPSDLPITEPRLYFSNFNHRDPGYAVVATNTKEFDYPVGDGEANHQWAGTRGISVGSIWNRFVYSAELGDMKLLVSQNITSDSRLLLHRDVLDRVSKLYPLFQFDGDPYVVVLGGRLVWILDGYTTSDALPYSREVGWGDTQINYIRNPIKVTVDAYTGEVEAYVIDANEPLLKTYRSIFPNMFKDASAIPAGLKEHFRFPEEMFKVQANVLLQYHVTDAHQFLNNLDAWDWPFNRGLSGSREAIDPYYVLMKLPGEPKEGFMLILPFTPLGKDNMSGWMAAHCDPDNYGQLLLYRFGKGSLVDGPAQMEALFNQDPVIADINRQFSNEQSKIVVGNLLVVPIGTSVMYVEPLFLQDKTQSQRPIPELKKVILALNGKIVVANTYPEALQMLFPSDNTAPPVESPSGTPPRPTSSGNPGAAEALRLLGEADAALRNGDFAKYGDLLKELKAKLKVLAGQ